MKSLYNIIIRNATILDGTGTESFEADIAIRRNRIEKIGSHIGASAKREIDAAGKITSPGFIDPHTHCDLTFIRAGWKRNLAGIMPSFKGNYNFLTQGVTTVITGNCGEGYGDIDKWKRTLEKISFGSNVCHLIPHGQVRVDLFGNEQKGKLSPVQMDVMKKHYREMMKKGAKGFSSGIEYFPGFSAPTEEFIELAKVVAEFGGIYTTHTRENSGIINPEGEYGVVAAVREAIEIGERGCVPVHLSHIKINRPFNDITVEDLLRPVEDAQGRGVKVTADIYPYAASSSTLTLLLPRKFISSGGIKEKFRSGPGKKELTGAAKEVFSWLEPDKIVISVIYKGNKKYEGLSIADIAKKEKRDAGEVYANLLTDNSGRVPTVLYFRQDMAIVRELAAREYVIPGSDGLTVPFGWARPHPRAYGTFPKMIREFVFNEKLKSLPAMIHSMTAKPADIFGIEKRGRIVEGNFADITIFDPDTICDRATYSSPHQYAGGILHVMVNGVMALRDGKPTGKRGGVFR